MEVNYHDKQGTSSVLPPWYPTQTAAEEQTSTPTTLLTPTLTANTSPKPMKGTFGAPTLKAHPDVVLPSPATTPTMQPTATAIQPTAPAANIGENTAATTYSNDNVFTEEEIDAMPLAQQLSPFDREREQAKIIMESAQNEMEKQREKQITAQTKAQAILEQADYKPGGFYEQLYTQLHPYKPKTAAEIQREIKRARSNKMIAAIGDGISAIANLWGTSQGAMNAYNGTNTLSGRYQKHYDDLHKRYMQNQILFLNGRLRAHQLDASTNRQKLQDALKKELISERQAVARYNQLKTDYRLAENKVRNADKFTRDIENRERTYQLNQQRIAEQKRANDINEQRIAEQKRANNIWAQNVEQRKKELEYREAKDATYTPLERTTWTSHK